MSSHRAHASSKPLSARTQAVYDAVSAAVKTQGYPPSIRELAQIVGLSSPASVKYQLECLEKLGLLRRVPNKPRAIEIIELPNPSPSITDSLTCTVQTSDYEQIPLLGRIAAGSPITADQNIDEVFTLPRRLTGTGQLFMLEVQGDSMIDAAICDGDYVVVRVQPTAEEGEIVAALLDDEATVKVFSRRNGHVWLLPRNNDYEPIAGDYCQIMGKVVSVMRTL